jgi:predicted nucleotidyltransferase
MSVDQSLLHEVVRRVLTVADPDRIILFGSAAAGEMNADSDLDLLVVEPHPANTRDA